MNDFTSIEIHEQDRSLIVTLNRPDQHNALNGKMIDELTSLFRRVPNWPEVRSLVITGAGRTFCAGADLGMMSARENIDFEKSIAEGHVLYDLLQEIDQCPIPVIGRINGSAFGGGVGIISCCDIVIAVERARFALSEVRLGLVPAVISPFVISKIGVANARELFLTGERFDVLHGQRIGLIQHIVEKDDLDNATVVKASQLRQAGPGAQKVAKELIHTLSRGSLPDLRGYLAEIIAARRISEEGQEGMKAFLEKRPPSWQENGQ